MKPWHPPEYVTLSLEQFTGSRRRKERLRFWGGVVIAHPPQGPMSDAEALCLAAWLVSLAGGLEAFKPVLDAVEGS